EKRKRRFMGKNAIIFLRKTYLLLFIFALICQAEEYSMSKHPFISFLADFVPRAQHKSTQLNKALWILETTGSADAADLKADLDIELRLLFNDPAIYQKLLVWENDPTIVDPLLNR